MNFHIVSIFPKIYESFLSTSILDKAIQNNLISVNFFNPRDYTKDKHQQIDDSIYWGWAGMLMKAKPVIDCVNDILSKIDHNKFKIIYLTPSNKIWNQKMIEKHTNKYKDIILVCWRYEWIDNRFWQCFKDKYPKNCEKISVWKYVLMWGELPSMIVIESISRLIPWVIKEKESITNESYSPAKSMKNIEYPQYTKPQNVYWYEVPSVLLSWNHKEIEQWREQNTDKE